MYACLLAARFDFITQFGTMPRKSATHCRLGLSPSTDLRQCPRHTPRATSCSQSFTKVILTILQTKSQSPQEHSNYLKQYFHNFPLCHCAEFSVISSFFLFVYLSGSHVSQDTVRWRWVSSWLFISWVRSYYNECATTPSLCDTRDQI